jgi:hypothetical protein
MLGYQRRRCPIVLVGTSGGDVFLLGFRVRSVVHYQEMAGVVQTLLNKSRLEQSGAYVREDTVRYRYVAPERVHVYIVYHTVVYVVYLQYLNLYLIRLLVRSKLTSTYVACIKHERRTTTTMDSEDSNAGSATQSHHPVHVFPSGRHCQIFFISLCTYLSG